MSIKTIALMFLATLLAGSYVYFFTDWFRPAPIQITPANRPVPPPAFNPAVYPVQFALDGEYELNDIKIVCVDALATNKYARPVWHLVTASNSTPTRGFVYGQSINGMTHDPTNAPPRPLEPNTKYRLMVEAGRYKGAVDFTAQPYPGYQ